MFRIRCIMGAPLEFEKNDVICCRPTKYPSGLALDTLYVSLKHREKTQNFSFAPSARRKRSICCTARRKRVDFLKCRWFCTPLEKFLRSPMRCIQSMLAAALTSRVLAGARICLRTRLISHARCPTTGCFSLTSGSGTTCCWRWDDCNVS